MIPQIVAAAIAAGAAAALTVPASRSWTGWKPGWLVGLMPAVTLVPAPLTGAAAVLGAAVAGAYALHRRRRARQRRDADAARVRDHCDALAADLAAGASPAVALGRLVPRWPEVAAIIEADRFAHDVGRAWRGLAAECRVESLGLVALAWSFAQQTGVGLSVAMRHVAAQLRAQARVDRLVSAELASARATAWLVALLPIGVLAMGSGLGSSPWHFLLLTAPGVITLGIGLGLIWCGLWWLESIIEGVRR